MMWKNISQNLKLPFGDMSQLLIYLVVFLLCLIRMKALDICAADTFGCGIKKLPLYSEVLQSDNNHIFFIESTGKDYLTPRQACSVESSIRNSNVSRTVVGTVKSLFAAKYGQSCTFHCFLDAVQKGCVGFLKEFRRRNFVFKRS